jgi:hypothetical protein
LLVDRLDELEVDSDDDTDDEAEDEAEAEIG